MHTHHHHHGRVFPIAKKQIWKDIRAAAKAASTVLPDETPIQDGDLPLKGDLKAQLAFLEARHLFVAKRIEAKAVAKHLELSRAQVYEWVSKYGWRDKRRRREAAREFGLADRFEVTEKAIRQQADETYAAVLDVVEDVIQEAREGAITLTPDEVKTAFVTARDAYKERQKLWGEPEEKERRVEYTETIKRMVSVVEEPKQLPDNTQKHTLTVEDAEFDEVQTGM